MTTEWITKDEAISRCKAIASVTPDAEFENFPLDKLVRLANGEIVVCYMQARPSQYRKNRALRDLFLKVR